MTSKLTKEWLQHQISAIQAVCITDSNTLAAFKLALAAMDSESGYLPLDYLHGHKDGLEWTAQLAEANHPETGDWLYGDPIELAKAIRKGPDMPPVKPVADSEPVAEITEDLGRLFVKIHYPTTLRAGDKLYRHAQPAPVATEEMTPEQAYEIGDYHGDPVEVFARGANWMRQHIIDSTLVASQQSPGSEPATFPGKWIPVSERLPLTHYADCEYSDIEVNVFDGERVFTARYATVSQPQPWGEWEDTYAKITHWQPLPAAPQEDEK